MADPALLDQPEAPPTSTRDYSRLTRSDVGVLLKLRKDGLTQTEIAKRLGCSQRTVSQWCEDLQDTTDTSKLYLRGQALRMAQHIVKKGRAADHVAVLKGLSVLEESQQSGLVVQIGGGSNVQVNVQLSPPSVQVLGEGAQNP